MCDQDSRVPSTADTIQPFTEDGHILMKKQTDFHEEDMKGGRP